MKIQVYLNEGRDNFFGFHNRYANAPALRLALVFEVDAIGPVHEGRPIALLERIFEQLNVGGDLVPAEPWTTVYRHAGNRSLSVGDVVIVGEIAYSVGSFGWEVVTTDDLLEAICRYNEEHGMKVG